MELGVEGRNFFASDSGPGISATAAVGEAGRRARGGSLAERFPESGSEATSWVGQSDRHAGRLLATAGRFAPEGLTALGFPGLDEEVCRLPPEGPEEWVRALAAAGDELARRLAGERDPALAVDLRILIAAARREADEVVLEATALWPFCNLAERVFQGIGGLLNDRIPACRRRSAVVRLRRYVGLEGGYTPLTRQAKAWLRARFRDPELVGPCRGRVEGDLGRSGRLLAAVRRLFERYRLSGWERAFAALSGQLAAYETFLRRELLPRCREDFRLPAEQYDAWLRRHGVDMPAGELVSRARVAFRDVREVVQALARGLARSRGWSDPDFRSVVAELRKEQLDGAEIVPYYRRCIRSLERVTEREGLMTARRTLVEIRLATEAGDDAIPVPHLWPRGPMGKGPRSELVLPVPGAANRDLADDFTFRASVWSLAAHEVHPGHALRIAAAAREGRSLARSLLGHSLAASEGWAVYVESEVLPYLPVEVQLIILHAHLARTARAFLDPGLHQGAVSRAEAARFLCEEVGLSPARARQEIERCTGWQPGGGLGYLCGQLRFAELRVEAELILGRRFDRRWYHDLLLSQGYLPLPLLREVILAEAGARAASKDRP